MSDQQNQGGKSELEQYITIIQSLLKPQVDERGPATDIEKIIDVLQNDIFEKNAVFNHGKVPPSHYQLMRGARITGIIRKAFRKMLETYAPLDKYAASLPARIVSAGCGPSTEAFALSGYFGRKPFGYDSLEVRFTGIDANEKVIETAKKEHLRSHPDDFGKTPMPNYTFIHGDAREVRPECDILLARHPNIAQLPQVWEEIFATNGLKQGGLLITTEYGEWEFENRLKPAIARTGYSIDYSGKNIHAVPFTALGGEYLPGNPAYDKMVIIARKQ